MAREREVVIIIGGGACGLKAAKLLLKQYRVILLEANARLGGRIHTSDAARFSVPVELGAEFIHGNLPATMKLMKKAGLEFKPHEGSICRVENGEWEIMQENFDEWDMLLRKMKREKQDMSLERFLDKNFHGSQFTALRKYATDFAEGFNLADTHMAGIKSLYSEWTAQQEVAYVVTGGYSGLITYLEKECTGGGVEIHTQCLVKKIDWKKNEVLVTSADGRRFAGSKVIIAVPAGILQGTMGKSAITINPAPAEHLNAFRQIGFGPVIKIIIEFREPFWKDRHVQISFLLTDKAIPTWWPRSIDGHHFLVGWKGGPQVFSLADQDEASIIQHSLESLSSVFRIPKMALEGLVVQSTVCDWQKNEFAEGGYSYSLPETDKAREILNTAVEKTIYFAGEALYEGKAGGTVEAALLSGRSVARKIKAKK